VARRCGVVLVVLVVLVAGCTLEARRFQVGDAWIDEPALDAGVEPDDPCPETQDEVPGDDGSGCECRPGEPASCDPTNPSLVLACGASCTWEPLVMCPAGWLCGSGRCRPEGPFGRACASSLECGEGLVCSSDLEVCVAPCTESWAPCESPEGVSGACVPAVPPGPGDPSCLRSCRDDSDCPGSRCVLYPDPGALVVPASVCVGRGSGEPGSACASQAECREIVCAEGTCLCRYAGLACDGASAPCCPGLSCIDGRCS
jgi:hypothetical protein